MDESTFPYRVDDRTRLFLSGLISIMQEHNVRLAAPAGRVQLQFLDKGTQSTTIDAPMSFTPDGIQITLPLNAVAKTSKPARTWLRGYQEFIVRGRNENLSPVPQRCSVSVEARVDGQIKYYLTYMVSHEDGSLAQNMPQGRLYATEALHIGQKLAEPADQQASTQAGQHAEPAAWLED